jgi:hypothetical protein
MKTVKLTWPMILGIIGSICSVVVGFVIAYFATGGRISGLKDLEFGNMWLLTTVMAILGPLLGLVGASIVKFAPRTGGVLMIFSVLEYIVVCMLIGRQATPALVFGGIGYLFLSVSAVMSLIYPTIHWEETYTYNKDYAKDNWTPHHVKNKRTAE